MKIIAGIIYHQDKILIAQRKKGKFPELLWEFPGGKPEKDETAEVCLKREIMEEFGLKISVGNFFENTLFAYENFDIDMDFYLSTCNDAKIMHLEAHEQYKWVKIDELDNYEFCPADIPAIKKLKESQRIQ